MKKLEVGDTIKCRDKEDMLNMMTELANEGIETEFVFEMDGKAGLWLEVTEVETDG